MQRQPSGPSWQAHVWHLACIWVLFDLHSIFLKRRILSTFKNQILHKSTCLASFEKKKIRSGNTSLESLPPWPHLAGR